MTATMWIIGAILITAVLFTGMIWLIRTAEQRLRHAMSTALSRPLFDYEQHKQRYRDLDDEYRDLVAQEQGDR